MCACVWEVGVAIESVYVWLTASERACVYVLVACMSAQCEIHFGLAREFVFVVECMYACMYVCI